MRKEFYFNIAHDIGTISSNNGYTLELNYGGFNGYPPKWDVRRWDRRYNRPLKGVAMTDDEIKKLYALLTDEVMPLSGDPSDY